jgi:N-glycosidase YbiA
MEKIGFTAVNEPYGWMGNMAPYPIIYDGKRWLTTEALFQSMRFNEEEIKELIRAQASPMAAKMKAKSNRFKYVVDPMSDQDVENMKLCVRLKLEQHPNLKNQLLATGDYLIFENIGKRNRPRDFFWGARLVGEELVGKNMMGKIWMEFRGKIKEGSL